MFDFSVLMATYRGDHPGHLEEAIESVYRNSLLPEKFLLVVDGPIPPENKQVVERFSESKRAHVLWLPENQGLQHALNAGLALIETTWVARSDADDINAANRFETEIDAIKANPDIDVLGSCSEEFDELGNTRIRHVPLADQDIRQFLKARNPFNHMSVMFRTALVREVGGYPDYTLREDYALWAVLAAQGASLMNLQQILVRVRAGTDLLVRRGGMKYAADEIDFQKFLLGLGIVNRLEMARNLAFRIPVFIAPVWLRRIVYDVFLRKG